MIEWVVQPVAELMVKKGVDKVQKSAQFQHSKKAIREAIFRELQFNQSLLQEISNESDSQFRKCVADELSFSAFERFEESFIPIDLYFIEELDLAAEDNKNKKFYDYAKSLKSEAELVTRCYLRLKILRARWRSDQPYNENSAKYVSWLIKKWIGIYKN